MTTFSAEQHSISHRLLPLAIPCNQTCRFSSVFFEVINNAAMDIFSPVFTIFHNKHLKFFWNQFLGVELHAPKVWIIAKWLARIAFQKGCSKFGSRGGSVQVTVLASLHLLPTWVLKQLPSPTRKVGADCSLGVSCPGPCGQGKRPWDSHSPGLTVDSATETSFTCEGKIEL